MIKLIICDIGGVIDTFDESKYISYITKKLKLDPVKFRETLKPPLDKMEVGKMGIKETEKILSKKFKVSTRQLEWNESFKRLNRLNKGMVAILNNLSRRYKIALLTNVSRSRHIIKMETLIKGVKYDRVFASCYLKMAKPDPKIYKFVLKKMKSEPTEAVFIDNLEKNVQGARRVGIKSIRFTNSRSLAKQLKTFGIK
jgi:epoxide hydrolase-like predicted phosphatase